MVRIKGHFDGIGIIFDEAVPTEIREGAPVEIVFLEKDAEPTGNCQSLVDRIWPLMGSISGPGDLSEEHDHYAHGAPKRAVWVDTKRW